jgi:hypothetical protein
MQRGLESQIISTVMKTLMTGAALAGMFGSDEEERIYQDSFRYFMPMYFNVIWDTIHEGDPFRVVQLYSKGTYDLLNELTD